MPILLILLVAVLCRLPQIMKEKRLKKKGIVLGFAGEEIRSGEAVVIREDGRLYRAQIKDTP